MDLIKNEYDVILERKEEKAEGSYTAYLFEQGLDKILKKVGEECTEVIIGAMKGSREETIYELADLCYHALVLMVEEGISPEDIRADVEDFLQEAVSKGVVTTL